ncbi:MAG TPA: glycosyltransferase [Gaiellaceae bacterium]|jgi:glycosyltransferase involved in cell wall biosynthesis|nr:glycosyltransferase [Gaiellaceae bacterium]
MRVLYFGTYERAYPRNAQVVSCLRRVGVEVHERHVAVWDGRRDNWRAGPIAASRLALAELKLLHRPRELFDALIVGYPGHFDLPAARRAARGRPVVFNPLVSLADTFVADRGRFRIGSSAARALTAVDRRALHAADLVVADTRANADHFVRLAGLPSGRVGVAFVGAEERVFGPGRSPVEPFTVLFVGKLIPLHGLETVLAAARAAPELSFRVVGSGQLEHLVREHPENVHWLPWVEYERLPGELHRAGCALGIFGTSDKAQRVIPNKAFQALACGTPLVTADTPAARELLLDGESALLVPPGDAQALANALRTLAGDPEQARRLGAGGRAAYERHASEEVLGRRWRELLERELERR